MNEKSFKTLFDEYWEDLFIYSFQILKNKQVCEDLIQQIFLSVWKNKDKIEIENPKAYLFKSLKFQIYKYFRDTNFQTFDIDNFLNYLVTENTQELLDSSELNQALQVGLEKLPKKCREIFYLSRIEQLSHKEIIERLNLSPQTIKNQINKAHQILRLHLKDYIIIALIILNK